MNKMVSFDSMLLISLLNSYSDYLDTINLNMYLDFKNFMKLVFLSNK